MSKTIMILGAGQLQVPLLQRAKERGLRIIVVSPDRNQPGIPYADAVVELDVRDEEGILAAAKAHQIDGVTTDQTDLPVRTAAFVAEKMGLPGIGYDMGCLFTDKYQMRKKCDELGLRNQRYALVYTEAEAVDALKEIGYPAIIKPIDSQASHGVTKITSAEHLDDSIRRALSYSRDSGVLIEQFIEGEEFSVDSYLLDGKCTVMAAGHYHPFSIKMANASYETEFPPEVSESTMSLILNFNKKVNEGFGLVIGRTHAEYIISGDECYLIEIGARGGGAFFSSDNVRYISGVSTEDYLLDYALGDEIVLHCDTSLMCGSCCTLFFFLPENCTVVSIEGLDKINKLPFIRRNNLYQFSKDMRTSDIEDKSARGFMVVTADNYEQLRQRVGIIRNTLQIMSRNDNGELLPIIWK